MKRLHLSPKLALPADFVTQTAAIIARKRRGKTYTGSVLAEELVKAGLPFVAIDPTGAWWGLRASADGKRAGLAVTIIGGEHGDVPLERAAGKVIADLVVDFPGHYVLDVSDLDPEDMHYFCAEFGERLFKRKKSKRFPMHLFGDEADVLLPQVPENGVHARCLRAYDKIIRRAGLYGLGFTAITQRPALVSKNSLSQVEVLIVLQLIGAQDRDAVEKWVRTHDTGARAAEFMTSLASLGLGEAWVWSPAWLDIFQRVQVRERETFNSSKTPEVGDRTVAPAVLAAVDLEAVKAKVAATIEKVKAEDPNELKRLLAAAQADAQAWQRAAQAANARAETERAKPADPKRIEVPIIKEADLKRVEAMFGMAQGQMDRVTTAISAMAQSARLALDKHMAKTPTTYKDIMPARRIAIPAQTHHLTAHRPATGDLGKGERAVLTAVAQHAPQGGVTREQLTVLTGYTRSSRNTFLQRLGAAGFIECSGEQVLATQEGLAVLGPDFKPLPVGSELRAHWLRTLTGGEQRLLEVIIERYPEAVEREYLTELTGYTRSSRNTFLQRLAARQLVEARGGTVKASELLF